MSFPPTPSGPPPVNTSIPTLFSVTNLNILITGGGGDGLGAMMTRALAVNGANKIFILGRRMEALEETRRGCEELLAEKEKRDGDGVGNEGKGKVIPIQADVTNKEDLVRAVERVATEVEWLDVLVVNSGIIGPQSFPSPLNPNTPLSTLRDHWFSTSTTDFNNTFSVNITGLFYTILAFLPLLQAANTLRPAPSTVPRPQIIAVTSIAAYLRTANAGWAYSASKAGAEHIMKSLATRLTGEGIRSNVIAPGPFSTEMTNTGAGGFVSKNPDDPRAILEGSVAKEVVPLQRGGSEEDIAGAILYLCSRAGAFLSGNTIVLDGGRLGGLPSW